MGGVMPQEWITVKFARKHQFGKVIYSASGLAHAVESLLEHPEQVEETRQKMQAVKPVLHPTGILQMVGV